MTNAATSNALSPAALLRAHYAMQHGLFVSDVKSTDRLISAHSRFAPGPMWNHIAWIAGDDEGLQQLEAEARIFARHDRRPVVYITENEELRGALAARGYEPFDREAWLALDTGSKLQARGTPASLRIIEARTETELSDFISVFYHAFRITEPGYALALQRDAGEANRQVRHFVGYAGNQAVCGGTLIIQGNIAGLYNVGTVPNARGRGYAAQLMGALVSAARQSSAEVIFLQVEQSGPAEALYRRLGFSEVFVRCGYRLKNWRPKAAGASLAEAVPPLAALLGAGVLAPVERATISRQSAPIGQDLLARIQAAASDAKVEPCVIVAAALAALWMRYSGEDSAAFAIEDDLGRVGFFSEVLSAESDARTFLRAVAAGVAKAWTQPLPPHPPEVLLSLASGRETREAPLVFQWSASPGTVIETSFHQHLYEKEQVRRMGAHLARLIEGLATQPRAKIREIDLLGHDERRQLLIDWNPQTTQLFDGPDVVAMFELQVERTPEAMAVMLAEPGKMERPEQLTYRQLNRRANQLARVLQKAGVGPEVMAGICLERSINMIVSLLAVWKAGGVAVPLDPAYPQERLRFMVEDTRAKVVISQQKLAWLFDGPTTSLIELDRDAARVSAESEKNLGLDLDPRSAAYVIYTSGSTGKPKGVVIEHAAIAAHSRDAHKFYGLSVHDRVLQFSSFNFDAAFEQIVPTLTIGAALVLRDNEVWSLKQFAECLRVLGLTVADIPTAYWAQLAREWSERPHEAPPNRLRLVIVGGEALPPQALLDWAQTPMGAVRLVNAYGPTETTITATAYDVPERPLDAAPRSVPIGYPRGGREAYVLDRWLNPAPINVPGELHLGGRMLARGYLNRPELTAAKFISNPFKDDPQARLYKTGDLVRYLPDGSLEFLGRLDDQVKIRGFRIELGEIEAALRRHPHIREAIVLAREDQPGEKRLVAYCVGSGKTLSQSELRRHLRATLPEYMVPAAIMPLEELPLLPSGKVDRRALPAPTQADLSEKQQIKRPSDPVELQIKLVFERVLKTSRIGVDVSFFELGGDSLQALELLVEIEKATGCPLPLGALYQSATIEGLAQIVRRAPTNAEFKCLVPLQPGGSKPPLYFVHTTPGDVLGYGSLIYHLGPDQPCWGFQSIALGDPAHCHTEIRQMAQHYVGQLKEHQPTGPYYLAGWCYGGIVAVEMARLLHERGDKVALLALLETVAMRPNLWNALYYLHRLRCVLSMSPERWAAYLKAKIKYRRESAIANRMRFRQIEKRPDEDPVTAEQTERRLAHLERIYNTNLEALNRYRPKYYPGKVTLFNAIDQDIATIPDPDYGWVGLAAEIEVNTVPGKHDTMLAEPNVSGLARKLAAAIQRAQQHLSKTGNP